MRIHRVAHGGTGNQHRAIRAFLAPCTPAQRGSSLQRTVWGCTALTVSEVRTGIH